MLLETIVETKFQILRISTIDRPKDTWIWIDIFKNNEILICDKQILTNINNIYAYTSFVKAKLTLCVMCVQESDWLFLLKSAIWWQYSEPVLELLLQLSEYCKLKSILCTIFEKLPPVTPNISPLKRSRTWRIVRVLRKECQGHS